MMATVPHITSGLGLRKFQANGFLLTRVYIRQDSSFGVVNELPGGQLRNSGLFPGRDKRFPRLQNVQTGCGAHPASYTMHIRDSFSVIM